MKLENIELTFDNFSREMEKLYKEKHFDYLVTIVGEDFGEEGLGCIYILENTQSHARCSTKVIAKQIGEDYVIPSVLKLWHAADLLEREVYDFLGIKFLGHPDMRRLFMRNDFQGWPLRKDFDMSPEANRFPETDEPAEDWTTEWNLDRDGKLVATRRPLMDEDDFVMNFGPNHPSTHGVLRLETIVSGETIKQTAKSTGKSTIKTAKGSVKTAQKTVKTAEQTARTAIKTSEQAAKVAQKTAQASAKAARTAAQAAKATAKATVATIKAAAKATVAAVKAIIAGTKALISAIAAGGWVAVVIIIVVCLIALIVGSCFGIFFSGEDSGSSMTMQSVVQEINTDYQTQLDTTKTNISYDVLEMSGSRAVWPEVLAVYAVKTTTDPNNPQDVATMDASKKAILKDIFWQMNTISSRTETKTEEIITETDDGHGNIVETKTTVTRTYLYISVAHKTAGEMADKFGFNADQRKQLAELLAEENRSMWSAVLYGIYTEDGQIVSVALSQIGNVGGQPYWSWYGFDSRVEWCACFVSWAANECGYIDSGIIPKFAGCTNGVQWFKDRGQWIDNSATPSPGMIIFFDWNNKGSSGPQDGLSDHVGIVERVEDGIIYTIEGNSGDSCRENHYAVGHYEFLGYGVPAH